MTALYTLHGQKYVDTRLVTLIHTHTLINHVFMELNKNKGFLSFLEFNGNDHSKKACNLISRDITLNNYGTEIIYTVC